MNILRGFFDNLFDVIVAVCVICCIFFDCVHIYMFKVVHSGVLVAPGDINRDGYLY